MRFHSAVILLIIKDWLNYSLYTKNPLEALFAYMLPLSPAPLKSPVIFRGLQHVASVYSRHDKMCCSVVSNQSGSEAALTRIKYQFN